MKTVTATTQSGKEVTVNTNLSLDKAVKILEELAPWNTFAARLLRDYDAYKERLFATTQAWILVVAQQHLDRQREQKSVTLSCTAKFFQQAKANVGELVFTEIQVNDYALQLFRDTREGAKQELVRVRRRRSGDKERQYLGTIQPNGKFVANKVTDEELKALQGFNRRPGLFGAVRMPA